MQQRQSAMAEQTEKAFLKQPKLEEILEGKRYVKGRNRYWKNIGLGFQTPREAIEGTDVQTNEEVAIKLESVKTAQHHDI
ncbi:hypothetical protein DY000_02033614 [Brassica cretica]|uniref:Small ribosomal subunit protein uS17 N-terminal domain-containing protein n=1 Tax=Brassica cretica TaxID=69181 RepID=A0ABQ7DSG1_BRACR|nr:hypothetical protein DY000_02033614 [Brassica cretica]